MNTDTNKQVVRELYTLINNRQLDALDRVADSSYEGPTGEKGAAGLKGTVAPLIAAFPDIQWTVDDLIAEGDRVVIRWSWVGTSRHAFRGVPPNGKTVTNQAIAIYQLKDGKITRAWLQADRVGFLQQIGVVPHDLFPNATAPR